MILAYLERETSATSTELAGHLGVTRQAVNLHVRPLIDAGAIVKTGSTRSARYFLASAAPAPEVFAARLPLPGLDEADVHDRVATLLNLRQNLRPNVEQIVHYAFTEVELDMRGVRQVGQGFADEAFRVFAANHPDTRIRAVNAGDVVAAMIRHVGGVVG